MNSHHDLIEKLNRFPMWTQFDELDAPGLCDMKQTISALSQAFQGLAIEERRSISTGLNRSAKYILSEFTMHMATEARRSGSRQAVVDGLMPVVMAGGRSDTATGGTLLAVLCRSAEKTNLDVKSIFAEAAQFAIDPQSEAQIRGFPLLPEDQRSIERYGICELKTPQGLVYETFVERDARPKWWHKLIGKRRSPTRKDTIEVMREFEKEWSRDPGSQKGLK